MIRARRAALAVMLGGSLCLAAPQPSFAQSADSGAVAGFESAGDLLRKCRENSTYARSFCFAYLAAVADSARSYRVWIGSGDPCLPSGLTLGKLADSFEAYLVANPSQTKAQAASVIVASLQESFPCPITPPQVVTPPVLNLPDQALPNQSLPNQVLSQSAPRQVKRRPQRSRRR